MARHHPSVLYISLDGLLEPIGHSQIVKPLVGLAARGWVLGVVSLERPGDLETERLRLAKVQLKRAGIKWWYATYRRPRGALEALGNVHRLWRLARRAAREMGASLLHCRGPVPALTALGLPGRRWVFDFRGYVIDERIEAGRWFRSPTLLGLARQVERRIFRAAAAVVSLTELAASDVREGRFGSWPEAKPLCVIPTCADYEEYSVPHGTGRLPEGLRERLAGRLVLAYTGSLNASYRVRDAIQLFQQVRRRRPDAHLLCLTRQRQEFASLLDRDGVPDAEFTLETARPEEMPQWLSHVDWGLHLLEPSPAKRASMPTKLAEFFAAGVRPVHFGCNEEVTAWVRRAGSGLTLEATDEPALARAADLIAGSGAAPDLLDRAREATRSHFGLRAGVERYDRLYRQLLDEPASAAGLSSRHAPEGH